MFSLHLLSLLILRFQALFKLRRSLQSPDFFLVRKSFFRRLKQFNESNRFFVANSQPTGLFCQSISLHSLSLNLVQLDNINF